MSSPFAGGSHSKPPVYQIRMQGRLESRWAERFDGMSMTQDPEGNTLLTGSVVDQAALYGLLRAVRDLGLPLLSLRRLPSEETGSTAAKEQSDSTGKGGNSPTNDYSTPAKLSNPTIPGEQQ